MADVIISDAESIYSLNEASTSFTTVQRNNAVILVVEVKKSLSVEFSRNDPSDVISNLLAVFAGNI